MEYLQDFEMIRCSY